MLALDCERDFDLARADEFFADLPVHPAVFLIEPHQVGAQPYLLRTNNLRRRVERLLGAPEPASKRLNLREFAVRIRYRLTGSMFEQNVVFLEQAWSLFPLTYRRMARLRPPLLLKLNLASEYPRCYVTRRIPLDESTGRIGGGGFYFGPFATRKAAEYFAGKFLDFFKVRRCQIKIRRDPTFPGCIYSEMKMCLAPCFAGCTKQEYDLEVTRVLRFLASKGSSLNEEWEQERTAASESLDFERAAMLHRKLEKLAAVRQGLSELARKVDELDAVILQRAPEPNTVLLFEVRSGILVGSFQLRFGELSSRPRSAEDMLRQHLDQAAEAGMGCGPSTNRGTLEDHLGLISQWYYSKPRHGEILFRQGGEWPYRRMIRACSKVLAPDDQPNPVDTQ